MKNESDEFTGELHPIRARSHLLQLLGEELIGDDRLAVFELVKNGYDADATKVSVTVHSAPGPHQSIVVQDSGTGMTLRDITDKWLELATDSKRKDRNVRTRRFNRLALGEKGIGRLACFKLGRQLMLNTKAADGPEYALRIDWDELVAQSPYLDNLNVRVKEAEEAQFFSGKKTGTRIEIRGLRRTQWARGDLRKLYRLITSLASPFQSDDEFKVEFTAPGREQDMEDMLTPNDFLQLATWKFNFRVHNGRFDWEYTFSPPHWKGLTGRSIGKKSDRLMLTAETDDEESKNRSRETDDPLLMRADDLKDIGMIEGNIFAYYRRSEILNASGNSTQLRTWLDDQTGVRVYRDGVRVFTYGERNDDWLGLNVRRINTPSGKLGTNSVIAAIHLNLDQSPGLREKASREGFDHNDAYRRLRRVVLSVFEHLERAHAEDRKSLDGVIKGTSQQKPVRFVEAMANLKAGLKKHDLDKVYGRDVNAIEEEFTQLRDVMVNAGTAGLNLAIIFHEIERGVDSLATAVDRGLEGQKVREQIEHLYELLHGFAPLLKKNPARLLFASEIIKVSTRIRESRFKFHKVVLSSPLVEKEQPDFRIRGASNLLSGALGNLLDNALFWARFRKERDERSVSAAVLITTDWDKKSNSGMIAVVDNGPGFSIAPEQATEAFYTTRPGGMGLGLYFANLVMEQCGGKMTIQSASDLRDEIDIPRAYDGAAVALRFGETK